MATVIVVLDRKGLAEITDAPNGPVGRELRRLGQRIERLARRQVGKKSGQLSRTITVRASRGVRGLEVIVGSESRIALLHHNGTRAHKIEPRNGRALRFVHNGRIVYARRVWHPGTKKNAYLTDNLARVVLT